MASEYKGIGQIDVKMYGCGILGDSQNPPVYKTDAPFDCPVQDNLDLMVSRLISIPNSQYSIEVTPFEMMDTRIFLNRTLSVQNYTVLPDTLLELKFCKSG